MALRAIRYGSGAWKQHEEQRQRLETRVSELETQLTHQQQALEASLQTQTALRNALEASESHVQTLEQQLQERERTLVTTTTTLDTANQGLVDSSARIEQLAHDAAELRAAHEETRSLLSESTTRASHLALQVDASREEEARLCHLLYAAQEKRELHEQELTRCQRDVRILTRANQVLTRQNDALAKDKHTLAQQLARMRSANPGGRGGVRSPPKSTGPSAPVALLPEPSYQLTETCVSSDTLTYASPQTSSIPTTAAINATDASFVWKQLQLASAKLQREQLTSARLRERVAALEASERALTVRFREASAARKRVEQRHAQHQQSNAATTA